MGSAESRPSSCSCLLPMPQGPSSSGPVRAALAATHCQVLGQQKTCLSQESTLSSPTSSDALDLGVVGSRLPAPYSFPTDTPVILCACPFHPSSLPPSLSAFLPFTSSIHSLTCRFTLRQESINHLLCVPRAHSLPSCLCPLLHTLLAALGTPKPV